MADPYVVEVPLRWSDMDAYGHVNNVQYLRLLEDARVIGFREWFPDRPTAARRGDRRLPARHRVPRPAHLPARAGRGRHVGHPRPRGRVRPRLRRPRPRPPSGTAVYAVAETGLALYDFASARPRRLDGRRARGARRPRRRARDLPVGRPVNEVLRLADAAALADLGRYAARARTLDDAGRDAPPGERRGARRLGGGAPGQRHPLRGHRARPADLRPRRAGDVRRRRPPRGRHRPHRPRPGAGRTFPLPPTRALAAWSAVTPPRTGWEPAGELAGRRARRRRSGRPRRGRARAVRERGAAAGFVRDRVWGRDAPGVRGAGGGASPRSRWASSPRARRCGSSASAPLDAALDGRGSRHVLMR